MIIAIDGPAGSGKSTTARAVASALGYLYLDTGAMYRAVAYVFLEAGAEATEANAEALLQGFSLELQGQQVWCNGTDVTEAIRRPEVGSMASQVSALAEVRRTLVAEQRRLAYAAVEAGHGAVLEGRDIGTVVFPDAALKVFLVAEPAVRAQRRQQQLAERGHAISVSEVLAEMQARDRRDSQRALAPLRQAPDALVVDTTRLTPQQQVQRIVSLAKERQTRTKV